MRILIVLSLNDQVTGNEVTARRHHDGLVALGHHVALQAVAIDDGPRLAAAVRNFAPDLIHLLHAYRSGRPWLESSIEGIPWVVTLTGTDINDGINSPAEGEMIWRILAGARTIITQNRLTAADLQSHFPLLGGKIAYLHPGIVLGAVPAPFPRAVLAPPGTFLFLHPAGIRPIKGNRELLDLFDPLAQAGSRFVVAFCGPILDPDYGAGFLAAVAERPWARYLGMLPPEAMPATIKLADAILNNSRSEGLPNALVEAAALGVPILARAVPGNADVVKNGRNGLLYTDAPSFALRARSLMEDPDLLLRLSRPHPGWYDPERETRDLLDLYAGALTRS